MSFQVDGIITYTPEGKINCTIVDMENKQKYTIVQSSIRETAVASEEDIAKLSGTQSGDVISNVGVPTGHADAADVTIDTSVSSASNEKSETQDTVAEKINTEIKDKQIPNVTKLEFIRKSPETGAAAAVQKIAGPTGTVAEEKATVEGTGTVEGPTGTAAVEEKAAVEGTGPGETSTIIDTSSSQSP